MDAFDRVGQKRCHADLLNIAQTVELLLGDRHAVGDENCFNRRFADYLNCFADEQAMRGDDINFLSSMFLGRLHGVDHAAAGRNHVVEGDDGFALHRRADDVGDAGFLRRGPTFIDNRDLPAKPTLIEQGFFNIPFIRAENDEIVLGNADRPNIGDDVLDRVQVIDGNIEEPLNLRGMKIETENAVGPGGREQISDELGADRHPAHILAVLASVAEVGNHRRDARGAGPFERIENDEQLHQVMINVGAGRLNDEHIPASNVLINAHHGLVVGEVAEVEIAQRNAEMLGDALGQGPVGASAEDFQR